MPCGGHMITAEFDMPFTGLAFVAYVGYIIEKTVQEGCAKVAEVTGGL